MKTLIHTIYKKHWGYIFSFKYIYIFFNTDTPDTTINVNLKADMIFSYLQLATIWQQSRKLMQKIIRKKNFSSNLSIETDFNTKTGLMNDLVQ